MKDNKFSAEYKKSLNSIPLPADYKSKILSALKEEALKLESEEVNNTDTETNTDTTETIHLTEVKETKETSKTKTETKTEKKSNIIRLRTATFVRTIASVAAAVIIIAGCVFFFASRVSLPTENVFHFSVASATNLSNISGAKITFRNSSGEVIKDENGETLTAYTDENGVATATLPAGEQYSTEVTAEGYIPVETTTRNGYIYISPVMNEDTYRAVLTWESQADLDAMLTVTKGDVSERLFYFHSSVKDDNGQVIAALDTDSAQPGAPETITFNASDDATFRFSVASYAEIQNTEKSNLVNTGAHVILYKGDSIVGEYNISENAQGNAWCVFEITDSQLIVRNELYSVKTLTEIN